MIYIYYSLVLIKSSFLELESHTYNYLFRMATKRVSGIYSHSKIIFIGEEFAFIGENPKLYKKENGIYRYFVENKCIENDNIEHKFIEAAKYFRFELIKFLIKLRSQIIKQQQHNPIYLIENGYLVHKILFTVLGLNNFNVVIYYSGISPELQKDNNDSFLYFSRDRFFTVRIDYFSKYKGINEFSGEILLYDGFCLTGENTFSKKSFFLYKIIEFLLISISVKFLRPKSVYNTPQVSSNIDFNVEKTIDACCLCLDEFKDERKKFTRDLENMFYPYENDIDTVVFCCGHEIHLNCCFDFMKSTMAMKPSLFYLIMINQKNCPLCRTRIYIDI